MATTELGRSFEALSAAVLAIVEERDALRGALLGLALGQEPLPSWCDEGWLCEHAECDAARAAIAMGTPEEVSHAG